MFEVIVYFPEVATFPLLLGFSQATTFFPSPRLFGVADFPKVVTYLESLYFPWWRSLLGDW
jgi:hypothetical protein